MVDGDKITKYLILLSAEIVQGCGGPRFQWMSRVGN